MAYSISAVPPFTSAFRCSHYTANRSEIHAKRAKNDYRSYRSYTSYIQAAGLLPPPPPNRLDGRLNPHRRRQRHNRPMEIARDNHRGKEHKTRARKPILGAQSALLKKDEDRNERADHRH